MCTCDPPAAQSLFLALFLAWRCATHVCEPIRLPHLRAADPHAPRAPRSSFQHAPHERTPPCCTCAQPPGGHTGAAAAALQLLAQEDVDLQNECAAQVGALTVWAAVLFLNSTALACFYQRHAQEDVDLQNECVLISGWVGLAGSGWVWLGLAGSGWVWLGLAGSGWVWLGLDWLGIQVKAGATERRHAVGLCSMRRSWAPSFCQEIEVAPPLTWAVARRRRACSTPARPHLDSMRGALQAALGLPWASSVR
jgi:hypothetical protein